MADIVQLKENGVFKYLKTHLKAVEGLETELSKKQNVENDTGWIKAVTSGVTHDTGKPLQYRKIGNRVMFRGGGTFPTAAGTTFLIMPNGFSPTGQNAFLDTIIRDSNPDHKCIIEVLVTGECKIVTNSYAANPVFLDGFDYLTI